MAFIRALVMSAYKEMNCLISQPKHYVVGSFKHQNCRLNLMCKKKIRFYAKNCVYLDYDLYSIQI